MLAWWWNIKATWVRHEKIEFFCGVEVNDVTSSKKMDLATIDVWAAVFEWFGPGDLKDLWTAGQVPGLCEVARDRQLWR
jgi:hypothetical protein